ncbi:MAG: tRNA-modifying protein YgfZ [Deltaproteobacteria bacterium]|nr:MAG: tRNA-modifying protein YgfZ [Deltaproteobacteria bacterium]
MDDAVVAAADGICVAFAWSDDAPEPTVSREAPGVIAPTVHPAPGVLVVGPLEWTRDRASASQWAEPDGFERHRVTSHRPGWRREIVPGRLPPEVGFADAVSYEKGCYLGQEPLARIHARGGVRRVLVAVAGTLPEGAAPPIDLSAESRADAGRLSSWVAGPDEGCGLALVHRDVAVPGTILVPTGNAAGTLRVETGPIGDDPGIGADRKARAKEVRAQLRRGR